MTHYFHAKAKKTRTQTTVEEGKTDNRKSYNNSERKSQHFSRFFEQTTNRFNNWRILFFLSKFSL